MEQKKRRFNWFDIAVVAVVLLGVSAWFFLNRAPAQVTDASFEEGLAIYYIEVANLTPAQVRQVRVGDSLRDAGRNIPIGEVVRIETGPYLVSVTDTETRTVRWEPVEGRLTMTLTIEAEIDVTETDILVEGQFSVKGGHIFSFSGPGYGFASAAILGLERGEWAE